MLVLLLRTPSLWCAQRTAKPDLTIKDMTHLAAGARRDTQV